MKLLIFFGLVALTMANSESIINQINEKFSADMLSEVAKAKPDQSIILSALSVLSPLAQMALASTGATREEILKAISMPDNEAVIKPAFVSLNNQLNTVEGVDLHTASKIYIAKDASLNQSFALLSRNVFDSPVQNVDFGDNINTANEINSWVENQTNHKIKDLVDEKAFDSMTRAVLVNAIYFKGTWKNKFDERATMEGDFHVTKDTKIKVQYMHKTADFKYGVSSALDAKLVELPYKGGQATFFIVLPNKIDGLNNLQKKLEGDPSLLAKAIDEMSSAEVDLSIPKFKIETTTDLKDVLEKLHINQLFTPGKARLDYLLDKESDLYISSAIQKAFIEVNEEGAEAAAANEFGVSYLSAYIPEKYEFKADHPFIFYLKNEENVLFNGLYQS